MNLTAVNGASTPAAVTKGGASGVQHVADCVTATVTTTSSTGNLVDLELLDGTPEILAEWVLPVVPDGIGGGSVHLCGLNIVGRVNESMTLQFQVLQGSQAVNLIGHDAT